MQNSKIRVLINSFPKSGTNLILSIFENFYGLEYQKCTLNRKLRFHPLNYLQPWGKTVLSGIVEPRRVKLGTIKFILNRLHGNRYTAAHLPYDKDLVEFLYSKSIHTVFIMRDPRDIMVSHMLYAKYNKHHFLYDYYSELEETEILRNLILGKAGDKYKHVISMRERIELILGWINSENVLNIKFEELIGEQGGSDAIIQENSILSIADFIGYKLNRDQARIIGLNSFGKGITFRKGRIGSWEEYFNSEINELFNENMGPLLANLGY